MGIFGTIMSKVLGRTPASPVTPTSSSAQAPPSAQQSAAPGAAPAAQPSGGPGAGPSTSPAATSPSMPAGPAVDVAAVLDGLNDKADQVLDWRHSIVDLMKLLALDSSLAARKELAKELNYNGDLNDSATMNIWLHKQIMVNLAANGGKLPNDLKRLA